CRRWQATIPVWWSNGFVPGQICVLSGGRAPANGRTATPCGFRRALTRQRKPAPEDDAACASSDAGPGDLESADDRDRALVSDGMTNDRCATIVGRRERSEIRCGKGGSVAFACLTPAKAARPNSGCRCAPHRLGQRL